MTALIIELDITNDIKKCGVTRLAKEGSRLLLEYQDKCVVIFNIQDKELFATLQDFEDRSKGKIDRQTQEAIKFCLSRDEYYVKALLSKSNGKEEPTSETETGKDIDQHDKGNNEQAHTEILSVEQAIRKNKGKATVPGMIVGLSTVEQMVTCTVFECSNCKHSSQVNHNPPLFSLPFSLSLTKTKKCPSCDQSTYGPHKYEEKSAIIIQLQDKEKQNALESLNVVLFEKDTLNVRNGEKAIVTGDLHVVQQRGNSKRITYLFAYGGIKYETPQNAQVVITKDDISRLHDFVKQPDMIDILKAMVAPTVIGHEDKKIGIVLMYVGAPETDDFRGRIHGLFIGPPGTAKSKLARSAKKLGEPQSRYSSTQGATGKAITAIIDKEGDSYVLRLGVLPQAKHSVCILKEIASLSMEEQRHLFDVMEEGRLTVDKYGFHREIDSPTTVLGTTNPQGGEWYLGSIEKRQIPLRKELVDRYDLVFVFDSLKGREEKADYAKKKLTILKRNGEISEDYTFLRKLIEYAKTFRPQLSEEAEAMIIDRWSSLDSDIFPTNRVLETMVRVSIAFARLHFSNVITAEIAKKAMDFLTTMFQSFDSTVVLVEDPREATCREITKFLQQNPNFPHTFQDCINYAAENNSLIRAYLGPSPVKNDSWKYRDIADLFKQGLVGGGLISIVDMNPLTLVFKIQSKINKEEATIL